MAPSGRSRARPLDGARPGSPTLTRLDLAVYEAIAATPSPALDRAMNRLTRAADHSKLSLAAAAVLATAGGRSGRQAAATGLASLAATSAVVNLGAQARSRAVDARHGEPSRSRARSRCRPPARFPPDTAPRRSRSRPGSADVSPAVAIPLRALAAIVAYSRVHTGVHFPGDVIAGALTGVTVGELTSQGIRRARA